MASEDTGTHMHIATHRDPHIHLIKNEINPDKNNFLSGPIILKAQ